MNAFILNIPGFSIACKTWGDPNSPLILALHGWLDNANSFDLVAPYLADKFYVVAIDLPGHGHSSHLPPGCYYHVIDGVFSLLHILDVLTTKAIYLLGHSLGGCLASLVAGVAPERIKSVVFLDALGPLTHPESTCQTQLANYLPYNQDLMTKTPKPYRDVKQAAETRAKRGYLSVEHAQRICERGLVEQEGVFYWRHDKRLLAPSPLLLTEGQVLSCLSKITAKSMVCLATEGFAFNKEEMQRRINSVEGIKVVRVTGGHHVHMEKPDIVGPLLVDFFSP